MGGIKNKVKVYSFYLWSEVILVIKGESMDLKDGVRVGTVLCAKGN